MSVEEKRVMGWLIYLLAEKLSRDEIKRGLKPRTYWGSTPRWPQRLREHNSIHNRTKKTRGRQWECVALSSVVGQGPVLLRDKSKNPAMTLARSFEHHLQRNYDPNRPRFRAPAFPNTRSIRNRFIDFDRVAADKKFARHRIQLYPRPAFLHLRQ